MVIPWPKMGTPQPKAGVIFATAAYASLSIRWLWNIFRRQQNGYRGYADRNAILGEMVVPVRLGPDRSGDAHGMRPHRPKGNSLVAARAVYDEELL